MSKDGVIFLHHDRSFDRTTDIKGNVHDFDWEDIKKINAGATFYKKNGGKTKAYWNGSSGRYF